MESESCDKVFFERSTLLKPSGVLEEQYKQIPILPVSGLVLFPGQILPLNLLDAREVSIIRHAADRDKSVGILTTKYVILLILRTPIFGTLFTLSDFC